MTTVVRHPPEAAPTARRRRRPLLAAALVAVLALVAVVALVLLPRSGDDRLAAAPLDPATLVPSIAPGDPDAPLPEQLTPLPVQGSVTRIGGVFDDRLAFTELSLDLAGTPILTGNVRVTTDVSELLLLDLTAAWYDAKGGLLEITRDTLDEQDVEAASDGDHGGVHVGEPVGFSLEAPRGLGDRVASVGLHVPALVNE